jgi:hypothetical protein
MGALGGYHLGKNPNALGILATMWLGSIVALAPFGVARPEQFWWMAGPYMGPQCLPQALSTAREPGRD